MRAHGEASVGTASLRHGARARWAAADGPTSSSLIGRYTTWRAPWLAWVCTSGGLNSRVRGFYAKQPPNGVAP